MTAAASLRSLKNAARKEMRQHLARLSPEVARADSQQVLAQLFKLPAYQQSTRISVYISVQHEVDTAPIIEDILNSDKACYVPRWHGDTMEMVRLHSLQDYRSLPLNRWKIPEPRHDEERVNALEDGGLDLIIMPGLAFDQSGTRLGHGKGYYDRYLEECEVSGAKHQQALPYTVALALSAQIVETPLPCDELDRRPHCILTPAGPLLAPPVQDVPTAD